jgi:uncharacterized membrane protein
MPVILPRRVKRFFGPFFVFAGVMHPRTRRAASWWSVATLAAVFPANVNMALNADRYEVPGGAAALWLRLPVQILFVAWALAAGRD